MSSAISARRGPTLADRWVARTLPADAVLITTGAALTALAAQVQVPLWPVPITGQTLAVLLVGVFLGAARGALSLTLYAVLGIAGLPVFSDWSSGWAVVAGPTGGYIVGFVAAAALTGWLAERHWDRRMLPALLAFLAGTVVPFAIGLPWLAVYLGAIGLPNDVEAVLVAGLFPFIVGGVVKAALGASILRLTWLTIERGQGAGERS